MSDLDVACHVSEEVSLKLVSDNPALDLGHDLSPLNANFSPALLNSQTGKSMVKHYNNEELVLAAQLARINKMKSTVLFAIGKFHDEAEKGKTNKTPKKSTRPQNSKSLVFFSLQLKSMALHFALLLKRHTRISWLN